MDKTCRMVPDLLDESKHLGRILKKIIIPLFSGLCATSMCTSCCFLSLDYGILRVFHSTSHIKVENTRIYLHLSGLLKRVSLCCGSYVTLQEEKIERGDTSFGLDSFFLDQGCANYRYDDKGIVKHGQNISFNSCRTHLLKELNRSFVRQGLTSSEHSLLYFAVLQFSRLPPVLVTPWSLSNENIQEDFEALSVQANLQQSELPTSNLAIQGLDHEHETEPVNTINQTPAVLILNMKTVLFDSKLLFPKAWIPPLNVASLPTLSTRPSTTTQKLSKQSLSILQSNQIPYPICCGSCFEMYPAATALGCCVHTTFTTCEDDNEPLTTVQATVHFNQLVPASHYPQPPCPTTSAKQIALPSRYVIQFFS
ncbi:hypothetical protein VP01_138g1 [Puccinia sorghi]|uniref:Uncharacterized protein n=1 Tax=Puccinia sorghi TaxID=27349 RepID=A0A0L6VN28_9BASI|nr:hypothetical protein VP01_138g1 [Puccinia sorghi]